MYIPVDALLAARQLAAVAPSTNAARDLSNVMGLLPRQDTAFIPKTDSQAQKDFEAEQAASSAAAAKQTACAVAASAGLPCSREVRRDLAEIIASASGISLRDFNSTPQRRQDTAFIPKTDSQEQKDFEAEQAASSAAAKQQQEDALRAAQEAAHSAAEAAASSTAQPITLPTFKPIGTGVVCIVSPCPGDGSDSGLGGIFRRLLSGRQKVSFNPKTDSQEQKDFEAAQQESIERTKKQQEELLRQSVEAAQAKAEAEKAAQSQPPQSAPAPEATPQSVPPEAAPQPTQSVPPEAAPQPPQSVPPEENPQPAQFIPPQGAPQPAGDNTGLDFGLGGLLGRSLSARQDTAFIPKTDSQAQKDFEAEQAASSAAAAAQTACLVRASVGLPCTREVANLMVRSLIASLD